MRVEARRSVVIILSFFVLIYLLESSISSLGDVDLWSGKYGEDYLNRQKLRYKRALTDAELEYPDTEPPITIRKCCNQYHVFNRSLECTPSTRENLDFFPKRMLVDREFYRLNSTANISIVTVDGPCKDEAIFLTDQTTWNHLIIYPSGSLVRLKPKEDKLVFNYSSNYCLDYFDEGKYVLMLCPCHNHLCIQKCCPYDEFYNVQKQKCQKQELLSSLNETLTISHNFNYYLFNKPLDCGNEPDSLIKQFNDSHTILVQSNGNLIHEVQGRNSVTEINNYCLDVFSEGASDQINGFYCQSFKNKRGTSGKLNKCCKKGESLDQRFKCQERPQSTKVWKPTLDLLGPFEEFSFGGFKAPDHGFVINMKAGDFVLYVTKKRTRRLYISDIIDSYPSETFCVDEHLLTASDHALIFAPCQNYLCLQKCCPYGWIFNLTSYHCTKSNANLTKDYELVALDGLKIAQQKEGHEYFFLDNLECDFSQLVHPNLLGGGRFVVQGDGGLGRRDNLSLKETIVGPTEYCVDMFSDHSITGVNGFFCGQSSRRSREHYASPNFSIRMKNARKNSSNAKKRCSPDSIFDLLTAQCTPEISRKSITKFAFLNSSKLQIEEVQNISDFPNLVERGRIVLKKIGPMLRRCEDEVV
ncbi:uncharacterized protein [Euwallacea similis]|uniref:uncharacterized protein n=1 Tax=Euwallacea similis TaxID=1736056 RepID=UPI00344DDAAB